MFIGITGAAGSGKSVIADALIRQVGFTRVKFASPLKNMVRTMLADAGFCEDDRERMIEGDLKETVIPELGVTPRHLMLTIGTEWGRECVSKDVWTTLWAMQADRHEHVVVDDVRFPNELECIRERGGVIWHVERPGLVALVTGHASEGLDSNPDLTFINDRSKEALAGTAATLARGLVARSCA